MLDDKVSKGWVGGLWIAASILIGISALTSIGSLISMGRFGSPVFWPVVMVIVVTAVSLMATRMAAEQIHTVFQTHETLETFIYHQQSQLRTMEQKVDRLTNMLDATSSQLKALGPEPILEVPPAVVEMPEVHLRGQRTFQS